MPEQSIIYQQPEVIVESGTLKNNLREAKNASASKQSFRKKPLFTSEYQKYQWIMSNKEQQTEKDRIWVEEYVQTEEYTDLCDIYAQKNISWEPVQKA